jgi:5-methylcytosine-specific restriction protein A
MIPQNITKDHILKALEKIDEEGFPESRESTKFELIYNSKSYPPKYVITIANTFANGQELDSTLFSGGTETNSFFDRFGFQINQKSNYFEPDIHIGDAINNNELSQLFKCSPQGGMRRSLNTNSLVIVSNHIKSLYDDRWEGDVFHYTGMGMIGPQSLDFAQNKTLALSNSNGINVHLFEVFLDYQYIYIGRVYLVGAPYQEQQPDDEGTIRSVWVFPLKIQNGEHRPEIPLELLDNKLKVRDKKAKSKSDIELERLARLASNRLGSNQRSGNVKRYDRDSNISEYAKRRAKGICQLCEQPAPFIDKVGKPYLESHHIEWLSKGGPDTIENSVGICPNCHKKMHILDLPADVQKLTVIAMEVMPV